MHDGLHESFAYPGNNCYSRQPEWSAEEKRLATTTFNARASCLPVPGMRTVGDAGGQGREPLC